MTGARHLGHYFSTMSEWLQLERDHELVIIIDDMIASLLYPRLRDQLGIRTLQVAREFIATGIDLRKNSITLTSMLPESHELFLLASMHFDHSFCNELYRETFPALLGSYQRREMGLPRSPSVAEVAYPQIHLAALALGVGAQYFQGGEEMKGYTVPMEKLSERIGLPVPTFLPGRSTLVLGTDGQHMATENALFISAPEEELSKDLSVDANLRAVQSWCQLLGLDEVYNMLGRSKNSTELPSVLKAASTQIASHFAKFRNACTDAQAIGATLENGARTISSKLRQTLCKLKSSQGFAGC